MTALRPPIGRIGGKSKLADTIISLFPPHKTYVEPFVGAGNILYRKPISETEIINDLDPDMYKIFKGIQDRGKWLDKNIQRDFLTREEFEMVRDRHDLLSLLYKYRCSFASKGRSFNATHAGSYWRANFSALQDRLKNVDIYNRDYRDLVKRFDSPTTFFYLDPPYENSGDYKAGRVDPTDIYETVKKIRGKWLLSYNDSPRIREIFKEFNVRLIPTTYTGNQKGNHHKINELIISNY
jgi:DNA adenine methylase